ncbi:MAG: hypothetical protein Fur007_19830 [Rhodoferax sp.]
MAKIYVMMDGVVIREVELTQERTTLGRRPYNDIVIENLTVSGEHAVLVMSGEQVMIEDLGSTNGTFIAGKPIKKQLLRDGDVIEVGKYRLRFESTLAEDAFEKTMVFKPHTGLAPASEPAPQGPAEPVPGAVRPPAGTPAPGVPAAHAPLPQGAIKVLSGPAAGREMVLTKVVSTVGKPGVSVAAITQRRSGYVVHHVEGVEHITLNGQAVGEEPVPLKHGDQLVLAGTTMQFLQR